MNLEDDKAEQIPVPELLFIEKETKNYPTKS